MLWRIRVSRNDFFSLFPFLSLVCSTLVGSCVFSFIPSYFLVFPLLPRFGVPADLQNFYAALQALALGEMIADTEDQLQPDPDALEAVEPQIQSFSQSVRNVIAADSSAAADDSEDDAAIGKKRKRVGGVKKETSSGAQKKKTRRSSAAAGGEQLDQDEVIRLARAGKVCSTFASAETWNGDSQLIPFLSAAFSSSFFLLLLFLS